MNRIHHFENITKNLLNSETKITLPLLHRVAQRFATTLLFYQAVIKKKR